MKNIHIQHIEDLILFEPDGLDKSIETLYTLLVFPKALTITTKWDGSPSFVCGKDPETGRLFVGTKSIFNKKEKKICYTERDINTHFPNPGLNRQLKYVYRNLPSLNVDGIIQGDLLYTDLELKGITIGGVEYITFQPNTLLYAVQKGSPIAKQIVNSNLGVAFHTEYICDSLADDMTSLCYMDNIVPSENWWCPSVNMPFVEDISFYSSDEVINNFNNMFCDIPSLYSTLSQNFLAMIIDPTISSVIQKHINACLELDFTPAECAVSLKFKIETIISQYKKEVTPNKTKFTEFLKISSSDMLKNLFKIFELLTNIKNTILNRLDTVNGNGDVAVKVFLTDENYSRFIPTNHEGYVVSTRYRGTLVKLVDRKIFSAANFNRWR